MFEVGFPEVLVIFFVILLLFGPQALPDIARALGRLVRKFHKAMDDLNQQLTEEEKKKDAEEK